MASAFVPLVAGNRSVLVAPIDAPGLRVDLHRLPYSLRILLENVVRAAALGLDDAREIDAITA